MLIWTNRGAKHEATMAEQPVQDSRRLIIRVQGMSREDAAAAFDGAEWITKSEDKRPEERFDGPWKLLHMQESRGGLMLILERGGTA